MPELRVQLPDGIGTIPDELSATLADVRALLDQLKTRLDADSRLAVDARTAGEMLGVSPRTLENHGVPSFQIGGRRLYSIGRLKRWIEEQECAPSAK